MKNIISLFTCLLVLQLNAQWTQIGGSVMDAGIPTSYGIDSDPLFQKIAFHPITGVMYVISRDYTAQGKTQRRCKI